jgi:predicted hotdog family 3-hydroxylacyl-ACP dehydratase
MTGPATLDRDGIAARIPHRGRMCLLDRLVAWSTDRIECRSASHQAADNPLRSASGLLAPCAIEYAAQAMALHGALVAPPGDGPAPGYLASVRQVRLAVATLHDVPGELQVHARRLAGDARQILYQFSVSDEAGRLLADGRATVVLNAFPE